MLLRDLLRDPSVEDIDIDGSDRLVVHSRMLQRKAMLRQVFTGIHHRFHRLDQAHLRGEGLRIELGSGISPMRDTYPDVLATDLIPGPHLDRVLDAEAMDLENETVRTFFGQNCFHHFARPNRFFEELERTLVPGGGVILLEPYYGPLASFIFKRLFQTEGFDMTYPSWEAQVTGPMQGANQALSYIIFIRDRAEFERRYPSLKIERQVLLGNYLRYLASGGLNFRQLCPDALGSVLGMIEQLLSPVNRWLALHHILVLRKDLN
jgi:SAM-dependent methyltransferase